MEILQKITKFTELHAAEWFWRLLAAAATLAVVWLIMRMVRATLRRTLDRSNSPRTRTLRPIVQGLVTVVLMGMGAVLALEQLGFDLTAVIAGAGVIGLAVGFGAQALVKDIISGFFLIFDQVLESGDFVDVDSVSGNVEEVGLRVTKIRSFDGKLWYVPNGQIRLVGNANREWMRAVVEVDLAYEQDVARGMEALQQIGAQWAEENPELVKAPPEVHGIMRMGPSAVVARLSIMVQPGKQAPTERELRLRLKAKFDAEGIEIPFGRQVVYLKNEDQAASA